MATIIKNVEPNFIDKLYIPGLIKGLLITIKHFFAKKITLSYPEEKHIPPPFFSKRQPKRPSLKNKPLTVWHKSN